MSGRSLGSCPGAVWEVSGRSLGRCPRRCPRRCLGSLSAVWHHESSRLEERRVAADSLRLAAERQQRLADRLLKQRAWVVKLESSNWRAECASSSGAVSRPQLGQSRGYSGALSGHLCNSKAVARPQLGQRRQEGEQLLGQQQVPISATPRRPVTRVRGEGAAERAAGGCSSDEEQALSPIGRHSRACCLSIRAPVGRCHGTLHKRVVDSAA